MKIKSIISIMLTLICTNSCFAISEINKELYIKQGYSYLLAFDEDIIRYKLGNETIITAELLSNIYLNRHEILIKASKETNSNIIIWTKSSVYNFNINIINHNNNESINKSSLPLQDFNKTNLKLEKEIKPMMDNLDFDSPPSFPKSQKNNYNIEIDKPPVVRR